MVARIKALVEPKVLAWARKTAGISPEDAARAVGTNITAERITQWENGEDSPTINQLRKLANKYKRPLSVFYLDAPPVDFQPIKDFRRLPGEIANVYSPALLVQIRLAHERRELVLELLEDAGDLPPPFPLLANLREDPEAIGMTIRNFLAISYEEQTRWREPYAALKAWRMRIEDAGVLVFQAPGIDREEMRGFSIYEPVLPVIVLNSKDRPTGRIFTLIHEFCHLMLREGGICDMREEEPRPPEKQAVEVFCNRVAAATLMPRNYLLAESLITAKGASPEWLDEELEMLGRRYGVSPEAVLRRLLTLGHTTPAFYKKKRTEFLARYATLKDMQAPVEQHIKVLSQVGRSFAHTVLQNYYENRITLSDVSGYLGLKIQHIPSFEQAARISAAE